MAGAALGGYAAYLTCGVAAAFTGGLGGAVCGIVLVGGGSVVGGVGGSSSGEFIGEELYNWTGQ